MASPQVSSDLIWEIVRSNNAFLVKSKTSGGIQFSRDPMNLKNKHSRKVSQPIPHEAQPGAKTRVKIQRRGPANRGGIQYAGFVNEKAVGVIPNEKGGVKVVSKKPATQHKPATSTTETTFHGGKSARNSYKAVANQTAKNGYRADLREAAVQRVSAIRRSQLEVKPEPEKKLRGNAAKKAAAAASS
ncbi:uncharacterized protein JN550_012842 [Neoarthrinium moseri]|uniref:uncharacterized protein n=1 Tax=Neoarthrinium moseri TaxID=1658444 RepID=UPI001FDD1D99|nr:uncharacterized protein JN550_012842 [Neoarthrinium moseri]KAI1858086.1 hypothetical protein JN550_012842 [Neoarthrinium moseri]